MNEAQLSHDFWRVAFVTALFVYNRTNSTSLDGKSLYELLFKKLPNLRDLRVFGCLAYPNLRPFNRQKFPTDQRLTCVIIQEQRKFS